jgi:hypothetical protein
MKDKTGVSKLAETAKQSNAIKSVKIFAPVYITQTYYIFESKINKK